jgi:hypothetical protein
MKILVLTLFVFVATLAYAQQKYELPHDGHARTAAHRHFSSSTGSLNSTLHGPVKNHREFLDSKSFMTMRQGALLPVNFLRMDSLSTSTRALAGAAMTASISVTIWWRSERA